MEVKLDVSNTVIYFIIYDENFPINDFFDFWLKENFFLITECSKCTSYFNALADKIGFTFKAPNNKNIYFTKLLFNKYFYIEFILIK